MASRYRPGWLGGCLEMTSTTLPCTRKPCVLSTWTPYSTRFDCRDLSRPMARQSGVRHVGVCLLSVDPGAGHHRDLGAHPHVRVCFACIGPRLVGGGYFLGFAATQLPLGAWLDRFGPKRVELAFLAVAVLGCVLFSVAQSFAGLLVGRILCGVGVSACLMAALTGYRRWYAPVHQMRANSWMLMVGALGMLASTLPVQWLLPTLGWRPLFLFLAAAVVLSMACIAWQLPRWQSGVEAAEDQPTASDPAPSRGYAEVWRNPYFRQMAPLGFVDYGGLVAIQTLWAGPWMVKVAGYSAAQAAVGLFWINACMLVVYWLWGWAGPRLAHRGHTAEKLMIRWSPAFFDVGGIDRSKRQRHWWLGGTGPCTLLCGLHRCAPWRSRQWGWRFLARWRAVLCRRTTW